MRAILLHGPADGMEVELDLMVEVEQVGRQRSTDRYTVTPPALPHPVRPLPAGLEREAVYNLADYLDSAGRLALKVRR